MTSLRRRRRKFTTSIQPAKACEDKSVMLRRLAIYSHHLNMFGYRHRRNIPGFIQCLLPFSHTFQEGEEKEEIHYSHTASDGLAG